MLKQQQTKLFKLILGTFFAHRITKSRLTIGLLNTKKYDLSENNQKSYNARFITETMVVESDDLDVNEKPFDLVLARFYLNKHRNAKERGIEFTLTLADMRKLLKKKTCHYTGEKLNFLHGDRNKLSLDRVDSSKGYTKENTVACATWVNHWKNAVLENTSSTTYVTKQQLFAIMSKLN